ncbi:Transcription factor [Colletotrichum scovillei]|nr:Transcription factor [Colletotrichum scovillei]KAH8422188.1 Transcription factor [Colletotrichum scovillei]KAH8422215.1 Transcription factor [Colletotrichum scovillei]
MRQEVPAIQMSTSVTDDGRVPDSDTDVDLSSVPRTASTHTSAYLTSSRTTQPVKTPALPLIEEGPSIPRFIGDLDPEARLLDDGKYYGQQQDLPAEIVGIWVQPRPETRCLKDDVRQPSPSNSKTSKSEGLADSDILDFDIIVKLSDIYFDNIQPILPLLNEREYRQCLAKGTLPATLAHAVCLVAAKSLAAERHLKLRNAGNMPLSTRQFCSRLHASLISSVHNLSHLRKITVIRIMGLLSLHHEGPEGAEQASGFVAQAIHAAQSIALHLCRPVDDGYEMRRVFWCLWILDRLNSSMHSRPCFLADVDIAIKPLTPEQSGSVAFDILFKITTILSQAIALYRPTNPASITGLDSEYPCFEQIVSESNGWSLPPSFIATLRVFWLSTAIISHRLKAISILPAPTPSRLRQQLSAIQIIRHMRDPQRLNALHPFPTIVYAVSLALSVSYQQLRYSRLEAEREDARDDFDTACGVLQILRQKWASADIVAALSRRLSTGLAELSSLEFIHLNRVQSHGGFANVAQQQQHDMGNETLGSESRTTTQQDQHGVVNLGTNHSTTVYWASTPTMSDLCNDMDDMSWAYLEIGNPINFDIPLQSYDINIQ